MDAKDIQQAIFQQIKSRLAPHLVLVDTVAELLNISTDSAYRRIRGEKPIALDEVQLLCSNFGISLDTLLQIKSGAFLFAGKNVDERNFHFDEYLDDIIQQLGYFHSFEEKKLYWHCKDLPIFYYYFNREIAAFKYYFWMKVIFPEFQDKKFSWTDYPDSLFSKGQKILHLYNTIPSVEIWNVESFSSTIQQIEFFKDTRCFTSAGDVRLLYEKLEDLLDLLEDMAEKGFKKPIFSDGSKGAKFELYQNDMVLGHNTILVQTGKTHTVFLNHSVINYVGTRDIGFCDYTVRHMQKLMRKSTLISSVSEKERKSFFYVMRQKIQEKKKAL